MRLIIERHNFKRKKSLIVENTILYIKNTISLLYGKLQ
jgi:hypothetical protein